jgi:nucleotide-binding universal stress UspA family protein
MRLERILVPTDFSEISLAAFQDAVQLTKHTQIELYHLHMVDSHDQVDRAKLKLDFMAEEVLKEHKTHVKNIVRVGDFMTSIGDVVCEINTDLVIMATHGMAGLQWITGSNAMRILGSSRAPILISQGAKSNRVKHIVVPLDFRSESRQKLDIAIKIASTYNASIHLLVQREEDSLLVDKMNKMLKQVLSYLSNHKVEYTLNYEDNTINSARLLDFAHKVKADLITIMNYHEGVYTEMFGRSREQEIITNKYKIPVLCVNAKQMSNIITAY